MNHNNDSDHNDNVRMRLALTRLIQYIFLDIANNESDCDEMTLISKAHLSLVYFHRMM